MRYYYRNKIRVIYVVLLNKVYRVNIKGFELFLVFFEIVSLLKCLSYGFMYIFYIIVDIYFWSFLIIK